MSSKVVVAGVGMIPFAKPGASAPYHEMGANAGRLALADAGVGYDEVEQAYAGYVYGDSTSGQKAIYRLGMTGIPIVNVNNNCSTGSTALFLARQAIASGAADCVLAVGFEQMKPGALGAVFGDRPSPFEDFDAAADKLVHADGVPLALRYFGGAGLAYMKKYGTKLEAFAKIRAKASRHAKNNPLAIFRKELSVDDVMNDHVIWPGVMTRLMACPPTCGAAAAVLVSESFAKRHGLRTGRRDRRAGDDDRHARHLRLQRHDAGGRLRHGARGGEQGLRAVGRRARGYRRRRAARLLRPERADHLRGARTCARRAAPRRSSTPATTPTAARSSPTPRAACSRRATRSARPASRNATS